MADPLEQQERLAGIIANRDFACRTIFRICRCRVGLLLAGGERHLPDGIRRGNSLTFGRPLVLGDDMDVGPPALAK